MHLNVEVLSKYSDEQLAAWAKDNKLSNEELAEVKAKLKEATSPKAKNN